MSIRIKNISVTNFMSFKSASLDVHRGIYLIDGLVVGSKHVRSNGAGKSNLFCESIVWGLFGRTVRSIPVGDVVNDGVGKNCVVAITMRINGKNYLVRRARCHKKYGNNLSLFIRRGEWDDISGSNVSQTQLILNSILSIDYDTFINSVIFGQGAISRFLQASDGMKKDILDEIFELHWIDDGYKLAHSRLLQVISKLSVIGDRIRLARERSSFIKKKMKFILRQTRDQRALSIRSALAACEDILSDEERIVASLKSILPFNPTIDQGILEAKVASIRNDINSFQVYKCRSLPIVKRELHAALDELRRISSPFNPKTVRCETCGQSLPEEAQAKYRESLVHRMDGLSLTIDQLRREKSEIKLNRMNEHCLSALRVELSYLERELNIVNENVRVWYDAILSLRDAIGHQVNHSVPLLSKVAHRSPVSPEVASRITAMSRKAKRSVSDLVQEANRLSIERCDLEFWKRGLSDKGMKNLILNEAIRSLNASMGNFIRTIFGDFIEVWLEIKESGQFVVRCRRDGRDCSLGSLSGGERRRVELCQAFALRELVRNRGGHSIDLLILDEPFESLDAEGVEDVGKLLSTFSSSTIFVISHLPVFRDVVDNVLTVVKENGVSRLEAG